MPRVRLSHPDQVNYGHLTRRNMDFTDHVQRVAVTGACIAFTGPSTLCDPAIGDGTVIEAAFRLHPQLKLAYVSDLSRPNIENLAVSFPHQKGVADITSAIRNLPEPVDTMVLTEILEHLEDPDTIVAQARDKARWLVASSPVEEPPGIVNREHLWSFGKDGYRQMLEAGGWKPFSYTEVAFQHPELYYTFQIWVCK